MNKVNKIILASLLTATFFVAAGVAPVAADVQKHEVVTGAKILVFVGDAYHDEPLNFVNVYNVSGNTVMMSTDYDFATDLATDDFDAVLISNINEMSDANMTAIKTWFETGQKLLWLGGDSDYGGFYNASGFANPMLNMIKSQLRVDAGAIADSQSNDAASYRVIANETGISSPLVDYVTDGFEIAPFHGPTSVFGWDYTNNKGVDLRNTTLTGVDVIVNSSKAAEALDQDISLTAYDFYAYSDAGNGSYPMMASEKFNGSYVVVTGEVIFDDYKFMYGSFTEKNQLPHQGMMLVDRMISWVFDQDFNMYSTVTAYLSTETVTETETETETETTTETNVVTESTTLTETTTEASPLGLYAPLFAIVTLGAFVTYYRKRE